MENKENLLEKLNTWGGDTLARTLDIRFIEIGDETLTATMPVNAKVHQPYGILHGGASCVLAETLGSTLSVLHVDTDKFAPVGTNINSNHLRSVKSGTVTGTARFIRKGNTMHVSEIQIHDEKGTLINHTTMTNAIIPRPE